MLAEYPGVYYYKVGSDINPYLKIKNSKIYLPVSSGDWAEYTGEQIINNDVLTIINEKESNIRKIRFSKVGATSINIPFYIKYNYDNDQKGYSAVVNDKQEQIKVNAKYAGIYKKDLFVPIKVDNAGVVYIKNGFITPDPAKTKLISDNTIVLPKMRFGADKVIKFEDNRVLEYTGTENDLEPAPVTEANRALFIENEYVGQYDTLKIDENGNINFTDINNKTYNFTSISIFKDNILRVSDHLYQFEFKEDNTVIFSTIGESLSRILTNVTIK